MNKVQRLAGVAVALLLSSAVALADLPQRFPNSQRYTDKGFTPATGRSGSASIQARALLGADGTTEIEISTAELDAADAPGNISKVQLKLKGSSGTSTRNYNNLSQGGYVRLSQPGLFRAQELQVLAHVKGIDPKRTDVVTAEPEVSLRPDLAVISLEALDRVQANIPLTIVAVASELNNDIGATTDCVLLVDGVQVDQSLGMSVGAGDTNTCELIYAFPTTGQKRIRVELMNVTPGDWNGANNYAEKDITVVSPGDAFQWYDASALEFESSSLFRAWSPVFSQLTESSFVTQFVTFSGELGALKLDRANATIQHRIDGVLVSDLTFRLEGTLEGGGSSGRGCLAGFENTHWFTICGSWNADGTGSAMINSSRGAGRVTFHSEGWNRTILNADGSYYTWNDNFSHVDGNPVRFGSTYELHLTVADGETTYSANPSIPLVRTETSQDFPASCETMWDGSTYCSESHFKTIVVQGRVRHPN